MMDVPHLTDEALELLKLLEKGAKHVPQGPMLDELARHSLVMGSPLKTHITGRGVRLLVQLAKDTAGKSSATN